MLMYRDTDMNGYKTGSYLASSSVLPRITKLRKRYEMHRSKMTEIDNLLETDWPVVIANVYHRVTVTDITGQEITISR